MLAAILIAAACMTALSTPMVNNAMMCIGCCVLVLHVLFLVRNMIDTSLFFVPERVAWASALCDQSDMTCYVVTTPLVYATDTAIRTIEYCFY
jgi:putative exporter of polyketide antibiotics